jgi:hypothetical protein
MSMMTHVLRAGARGAARWWPLAIPFALGLACVLIPIPMVIAAGNSGTDLEGALIIMGLLGFASVLALLWALVAAFAIQRRDQRSLGEFVLVLFAATLPVAWLQCVNLQGSLMGLFWGFLHPPDDGPTGMIVRDTITYAILFIIASSCAYFAARDPRAGD